MTLLLLFIGSITFIFGQTIHIPVHKDTVHMNVDAQTADVQWQVSSDSSSWTDISGATSETYAYVVNTEALPQYFRAVLNKPDCDPEYSAVQSLTTDMPTYYWSDADAWDSGSVPQDEENPTIPAGRRIYLDINTAALSGLTINGNLEFLDQDLKLTSDWIMVMGLLQVGTEESPFTSKAIITLAAENPNQNIMSMGTRGIMVMGGQLELHAVSPQTVFTKIDNHAELGTTTLSLETSPDWNAGEQIIIAPTDYYAAGNGISVTQRVSLNNVTGSNLQIADPLNAFRWGLLQYATPTGMSLDPANQVTAPAADTLGISTPTILDERATVGHLTRNIVVRAPDDFLWQNQGFGVHIMIMGTGAEAHLDGVEIQRGGQRGRLGRYPFHWHMLSYAGTATLDDAEGQYFRNSVVNQSRNRGVVIHGTNGVTVQRNVIYDIEGHGIFTEDAVERRNLIDSNLVLHVRNPQLPPQDALKQHEVGERGSSGFWISNPDNTITNNIAADCGTNGFWIAFPQQPWGESASVLAEDGLLLNPSRLLFGVFDNNTAHSNRVEGIMLDNVEINNDGETYPHQYQSTTDGRDIQWPYPTLRRFLLSRYKVWKNSSNGIWDRAVWPTNLGTVSADNCGRFYAGSGADGLISHSLVVGTSLNHMMNGTDRPPQADFAGTYSSSAAAAFATYHSTFDIRNNVVINFQAEANERSGVFSTDDYYIRPVDKGQVRNYNNLIINSHPGVKLRAPYDYFTLASALWDPHGIWGPEGNYVVYDEPFLTHGKTVTPIAPSVDVAGGVSVPGPFYGFEGFVLHGVGSTPPQNQPYFDLMGIHVRRLDPTTFQEQATWTVTEALASYTLNHMRDFATTPDSYYELTFPEETDLPTDFQMNVENMLDSTDTQVMAIAYDGSLDPIVLFQAYGSFVVYDEVASRNEVINSAGSTCWFDRSNNLMWVKIRGGIWQYWTNDPNVAVPTSDELLYEPTVLRIYEP